MNCLDSSTPCHSQVDQDRKVNCPEGLGSVGNTESADWFSQPFILQLENPEVGPPLSEVVRRARSLMINRKS